jgi:hypothetical protein
MISPIYLVSDAGTKCLANLFDFAVKSSPITSSPSSYAVIAPSPQRDCSTLVAWSRQLSMTPPYLTSHRPVSRCVLPRRITSRLHICLAPHTRFYGFCGPLDHTITCLLLYTSLLWTDSLLRLSARFEAPQVWYALFLYRSYGLIRLFTTLYGLSIRFYNPRIGYTHRRLSWGY